jgi:integrase
MARRANGEGTIGKRKDGTYYGSIRLGGEYQWCYGRTRKEVADKLRALRQKYEQGVSPAADKVTVAAFIERWLDEVVWIRNKPSTYTSYSQVVYTHIIPHLGKIPLTALRPDHVQALINQLTEAKKAPRTIRNVRAVLRQALSQAVRWRYVTYNAATLVETPQAEQYKVQPLTKAEARQLLNTVKGHRLEVLYLLALTLGLREGELLGLLLSSIDLDRASVKVDGALIRSGKTLIRAAPKTKSSIRTLPLPASLIPHLKAHIERQKEQFADSLWLFTNESGGPLSRFTLLDQFQALLKKAELRKMRFHDLRHSCATFLIARGEHPRTVMDILGHSQISTTMNIYGHILDGTRTAAIAGLDDYLSEGK